MPAEMEGLKIEGYFQEFFNGGHLLQWNLVQLLQKKAGAPNVKRRLFTHRNKSADVLDNGRPIDLLYFVAKRFNAPGVIDLHGLPFPWTDLYKCRCEVGTVDRSFSGRIPEEVIPVSTLDVVSAQNPSTEGLLMGMYV